MNTEAVKIFYDLLGHKKQTEIRAMELSKDFKISKVKGHYFVSSQEDFIKKIQGLNEKYNVYAGLNERIDRGTEAKDVISVKRIFVDIDCITKPASAEDIKEAEKVTDKIIFAIEKQTGSRTTKIYSGNGYQLVYRIPEIELTEANREEVQAQVQQFLKDLIKKYSNDKVKLDNVGDLPRIIRIAGTTNIKGGKTSEFVEICKEENSKLKDYILSLKPETSSLSSIKIGELETSLKEIFEKDERVKSLFNNEPEAVKKFQSRSEAEQSLVCHLIGLGFGKQQIFKIMASCKLGKWQETNIQYRELTYKKALEIISKKKKDEVKDFDFSSKKPSQEVRTLNQLREIIIKNFPSIWFETEACLSACATLGLKNLNGCPSLNLVGNPSGEKTTVLSFFYGQDKTYISDDFTPRAFVSHSANVKGDELKKVDLLPKIKDRILITPELAPLFEAPKDKLIDNFAMLTRVLDGEGLNRDSGTHGHRGYSGDYKFIWIGATTPLKASVWNVMGKIGNRLFFLNMRDKNRNNQDYLEMFRGRAYEEKVKECRGAVRSFLNNLFEQNQTRSLEWDAEGDIFLLPEIIKYAKFLSNLRGSLMLWKSEEQGKYEFNFPIIEEPPRAINALYNLAKGHALINNRTFLRNEDLEIVRAVCFSSMPHDRVEFLKLLGKHEGKLTTQQIQNELNCSDETARKTMNIFKILGIVNLKSIQIDYSGTGRPMHYIEIVDEFRELLEHTQVSNGLGNNKPNENKGVSDDYDSIKPEEFVKKSEKKTDTHPSNNLENT